MNSLHSVISLIGTEVQTTDDRKSCWKDPRWVTIRNRVFTRDNGKCTRCGATDRPLVGHHIAYVKGANVWEYPDECIATICTTCHEEIHKTQGSIFFASLEDCLAFIRAKREKTADAKTPAAVSVAQSNTISPPKTKIRRRHVSKSETTVSTYTDVNTHDLMKKWSLENGLMLSYLFQPFYRLAVELRDRFKKCRTVDDVSAVMKSCIYTR